MLDPIDVNEFRKDYLNPNMSIAEISKKHKVSMKTINKYCKDLHSQRSINLIRRKVMVKLAYASGAPMNSIVNEYNYTENTIKEYGKGLKIEYLICYTYHFSYYLNAV